MRLRNRSDQIFSYISFETLVSFKKLEVDKENHYKKLDKRDRILIKSYRVISFFNCLGKVVEKLVAESPSQFCEKFGKLHKEQMEAKKYRSIMDAAAILVQQIYKG